MKGIYILIAGASLLFSGCVAGDEPEIKTKPLGDGSVTLRIGVPKPVQMDMGTRAAATDFNTVRDLNIVIAEGAADDSQVFSTLFFELGEIESGSSISGGANGVVYSEDDDGLHFGVHFSKEWLGNRFIPGETCTFFLVGNYGKEISGVTTVAGLRALKEESDPDMPGWVGDKHMMFGETGEDITDDPNHTDGGRSLKASMKRTAAMVTVKIDGKDLANGVIITPLSVSLHNVPTWCYLGKDNEITTLPLGTEPLAGAVAENGEYLTATDFGWTGSIIGTATTGLTGVYQSEMGVHFDPANLNFADLNVHPLFLFENLHGDTFGEPNNDAGQAIKRPAGTGTSADAIASATRACSYLQVSARYQQLDPATKNLVRGGNVEFRVFLGSDVWQNFDVERNSCYQFTLDLNGMAVTEGGQYDSNGNFILNPAPGAATWRVSSELSGTSVLSESDFILNGGGEMVIIDELLELDNSSGWSVSYDGSWDGDPYIWWVHGGSNNGWYRLPATNTDFTGQDAKLETLNGDGNIQYRIYVEPMTEGVSRQITFRFSYNAYASEWITVTQFGPIILELTEENTTEEIRQYMGDVLKKSVPLTIYLDRVDNDAITWGFSGVEITEENSVSGAQNSRNWLASPSMTDEVVAADPFGSSAMIKAAFTNYYQMATPDGFTNSGQSLTPAPTITNIRNAAAGAPSPIVPNSLPSRAEWKLLEMLQQSGVEVFDPGHPVLPWLSYWTSDAPSGGSQSYVYQMGQGLDGLSDMDGCPKADRNTLLRYRLIYIP